MADVHEPKVRSYNMSQIKVFILLRNWVYSNLRKMVYSDTGISTLSKRRNGHSMINDMLQTK